MNDYLQAQLSAGARKEGKFDPYEAEGKSKNYDIDRIAEKMLDLGTFNIKAASLNDTKSQKLYKQLNPDYNPDAVEKEEKKKGKKLGTGKGA